MATDTIITSNRIGYRSNQFDIGIKQKYLENKEYKSTESALCFMDLYIMRTESYETIWINTEETLDDIVNTYFKNIHAEIGKH